MKLKINGITKILSTPKRTELVEELLNRELGRIEEKATEKDTKFFENLFRIIKRIEKRLPIYYTSDQKVEIDFAPKFPRMLPIATKSFIVQFSTNIEYEPIDDGSTKSVILKPKHNGFEWLFYEKKVLCGPDSFEKTLYLGENGKIFVIRINKS